jgi:hypothetical protein
VLDDIEQQLRHAHTLGACIFMIFLSFSKLKILVRKEGDGEVYIQTKGISHTKQKCLKQSYHWN